MKGRTVLDHRMDKIRALEESGRLATKLTNRTLRKILSNKLAVLGALSLYLDFVNLFLYLLRFFGRRSE